MSWRGIHGSLKDVAADRTHGARELVLRAARIILGHTEKPDPFEPPIEDRTTLARELLGLQPEMAPFYHLAALIAEPASDVVLADRLRAFIERLEAEPSARAVSLLRPGSRIMTYSRSGTVLSALLEAQAAGVVFEVWIGEGRPGFEGRTMASELAAAGVAVRLLTDAALMSVVAEADQVWVGADAVGRERFRNKVGTRTLCATAGEADRRPYVLVDETKFLPEELWPASRDRPPEEVWPSAPGGVVVRNPYFEDVDLKLTEGIIAGDEVLAPGDLKARIDSIAASIEALIRSSS